MEIMHNVQLSRLIDMDNPVKIIREVGNIFASHYPKSYFRPVKSQLKLVKKIFEGKFPGYKKCNTYYHDLRHTLDTFLAAARIMDGYNLKEQPLTQKLPPRLAALLLTASLLHDVGYIQEDWDEEGTGAKYTKFHIKRSTEFIQKNYRRLNIREDDIEIINSFIRCTGLAGEILLIKFTSDQEKAAGAMLGTADLVGQMSDRTYLEKLLFLYYEFREADIPGFNTEFDIIKKTIEFYETTRQKFKDTLLNMNTYLEYHFRKRFNIEYDLYQVAIERHIGYIKRIIADDTTNFRSKLNRADWVEEYVYS